MRVNREPDGRLTGLRDLGRSWTSILIVIYPILYVNMDRLIRPIREGWYHDAKGLVAGANTRVAEGLDGTAGCLVSIESGVYTARRSGVVGRQGLKNGTDVL